MPLWQEPILAKERNYVYVYVYVKVTLIYTMQNKEKKKKKNVDDTKSQRLRSIDKRCSAIGKRVWERRTIRWVDRG